MLTDKELKKIFSWEPYREDWPVDRNKTDEITTAYVANVIDSFVNNKSFVGRVSQDGGNDQLPEIYLLSPRLFNWAW